MSDHVDDLTVEYENELGEVLVKQLDKVILSKGAWATILFRYQELHQNPSKDGSVSEGASYGPDKYVIRRYQKRGGDYIYKSKFVISSAAQARKIVEALTRWIDEAAEEEKEAPEE